jgi:hypothetical protein
VQFNNPNVKNICTSRNRWKKTIFPLEEPESGERLPKISVNPMNMKMYNWL